MKALLRKLLGLKPSFCPKWLFFLLLVLCLLFACGVAVAGLWVMFTQVDYM